MDIWRLQAGAQHEKRVAEGPAGFWNAMRCVWVSVDGILYMRSVSSRVRLAVCSIINMLRGGFAV